MRPFGALVFGRLGDMIGRKPIILAGMALAVVTYFPLFNALTKAANPDLAKARQTAKVSVTASAGDCSFQGNPVAREIDFTKSCDIAKRFLAQNSVSYDNVVAKAAGPARWVIAASPMRLPQAAWGREGRARITAVPIPACAPWSPPLPRMSGPTPQRPAP